MLRAIILEQLLFAVCELSTKKCIGPLPSRLKWKKLCIQKLNYSLTLTYFKRGLKSWIFFFTLVSRWKIMFKSIYIYRFLPWGNRSSFPRLHLFSNFCLLNAIANTLSLFESNVHLYYQKDRKQIIHEPIF